MQKKRFLAAKKAALLSVALATSTIPITSQAGIPVIDGGNLVQNILTALESVAQTLTQIDMLAQQVEQYQTQLQQYENQLQNTLAPAASIWDSASSVIDKLIAAQSSLSYYENKLGSLNSYLDKFQDANYYRNSPCFTPQGEHHKSDYNPDIGLAASCALKLRGGHAQARFHKSSGFYPLSLIAAR